MDIYGQLLDMPALETAEHSEIQTNLTSSQTHVSFIQRGFQANLHTLPTTLESDPPPAPATSSAAPIVTAAARAEDAPAKPKPPRASRVPKGVVLGVTPPPDPERWLKKRERTKTESGRKRKGGKEGMGAGATQGSAPVPEKSTKGKRKK